ncbi:hypothetical protein EVAR_25445_1 [Eumeta japonica]|uniref:Uncharacterized protein n=1 Tax=Eumeta variegata TaxID=151549 RepID=A0A4C1VMI0_EUMVA|nr:hypothetical protein EVAR_25445_1 [Eumeta japonica]
MSNSAKVGGSACSCVGRVPRLVQSKQTRTAQGLYSSAGRATQVVTNSTNANALTIRSHQKINGMDYDRFNGLSGFKNLQTGYEPHRQNCEHDARAS